MNTGWTGGSGGTEGKGERFPIPVTRAIIAAIQSGTVSSRPTQRLGGLNLVVPTELEGVDSRLLNPRNTWQDTEAYDQQRLELSRQFIDNFAKFEDIAPASMAAGPTLGDQDG